MRPASLEQQVVESVDRGRARAVSASRQHVVDGDAGHLGRVLHDEVQAGGGTLPRRHGEHVDAVERDRALEHLVARLAHDDRRQRALAGAVGAHHGVDLAARHGQIDAAEDLLAADGGAQRADLQGGGHDAHLDLAVDDLRPVHRHRLGRRQRDRLAGLQAERAAVLGALQLLLVAPHLALRQRHVGVAAHVADGVDVVVDAHDGDGDAVDLHPADRAGGELVEREA